MKQTINKTSYLLPQSLCTLATMGDKLDEFPLYRQGLDWVENFMGQPHPDLGRPGAICPFVARSLHEGAMTFAVMPITESSVTEGLQKLSTLLNYFQALTPTDDELIPLQSLVVFFSGLSADKTATFIEASHRVLKGFFISHGLMLGEFHPESHVPSVHQANFHPLKSPLPAMVLRHLSLHDFTFINLPKYTKEMRIHFLNCYLHYLRDTLPDDTRKQAEKVLHNLLAETIQTQSANVDTSIEVLI